MELEYFPHFMRANFPKVEESNETLIELGSHFKDYLLEKFDKGNDKLSLIWDISPKSVIMAQVKQDPFKLNGYHPALIIHFHNFLKHLHTLHERTDNTAQRLADN